MGKVRIYEYLTHKKCSNKEYRDAGCRAGSQMIVYEGVINATLKEFMTFYDNGKTGYNMTNYDVIEYVNPSNIVDRHFYKNGTFYPMDMYEYKPDPNWDRAE
jgi:hypothetical protein